MPATPGKRYYAVRAPARIVGLAEEGGAHGIHEDWESVQRFVRDRDASVRAAMAGNHRKFRDRREAEEFAASKPEMFFVRKEVGQAMHAMGFYSVAVLTLALVCAMIGPTFDYFQCSKDYLQTQMHCYGMLQALALVSHYQLQFCSVAGAALVFLLVLPWLEIEEADPSPSAD